MRIALIEACDTKWLFRRFSYPLQLGYLASYILQRNPRWEVIVAEDLNEILRIRPDIVGISSYSINYQRAQDFAKVIKQKLGIPVIIGGFHISALPETMSSIFDAGVLGEGEETFFDVLTAYDKSNELTPSILENISGIIYHNGNQLIKTSPRLLISPIDRIPPPARELYKINSGTHYISTSRGCPFKCLFCAPCVLWQKTRSFSGSYVIKEIGLIIKQFADTLTHLMIVDDLFIINKKRLMQLRDFYQKSGLNQVLIQQCNVRADLIDDETAQLLKDMNFLTVNFGAESGSDKILKYYGKKSSVAQNQKAVDILYNHGIRTIPSFIIGAPEETEEDLEATLNFIENNHEKFAGFEVFPLVPMPGSRLWEYSCQKGITDNNTDWSRLEPSLLDFDKDRYIYLIENIKPNVFINFIKFFQDIYKKYNPAAMAFREKLSIINVRESVQNEE